MFPKQGQKGVPDGRVMPRGVFEALGGGDSTEDVLCAWCGAEQEEEPGRLQVGEAGELLEELGFRGQTGLQLAGDERRVADRHPQRDKPTLRGRLVSHPHVRPQLIYAWGGWPRVLVIDTGFANVGCDARVAFNGAGDDIVCMPGVVPGGKHADVI